MSDCSPVYAPVCPVSGPGRVPAPRRFRGLVWPAFGPRSKRRARTEKRQAESPDALLRRGSHFCPQCGQFQAFPSGVVNPRKPRRVTLSSGDEDAPSANLIRKKVPKMRSSKETEGFPYGSNRICYIELFATGEIKQLATYHDKIEGYVHAQSGISKLFAVWPGQWRSDLFIIDDLEAFRIGQRLIRV